MNIYLIVDVLILIIIGLYVWRGSVDGFVKTFFHFFSYVGAFICARLFSKPISVWLSEKVLYSKVYDKIDAMLSNVDIADNINAAINAISEKISSLIQLLNIDLKSIANSALVNQENVVEKITEELSLSVSLGISNILAFVMVFAIALLVFKVAASLLDAIAKLPVLNLFNRIGGMVTGGIKGFLVCWILVQVGVWAVALLVPEMNFAVEQTNLARFFYNIFPIKFLS